MNERWALERQGDGGGRRGTEGGFPFAVSEILSLSLSSLGSVTRSPEGPGWPPCLPACQPTSKRGSGREEGRKKGIDFSHTHTQTHGREGRVGGIARWGLGGRGRLRAARWDDDDDVVVVDDVVGDVDAGFP